MTYVQPLIHILSALHLQVKESQRPLPDADQSEIVQPGTTYLCEIGTARNLAPSGTDHIRCCWLHQQQWRLKTIHAGYISPTAKRLDTRTARLMFTLQTILAMAGVTWTNTYLTTSHEFAVRAHGTECWVCTGVRTSSNEGIPLVPIPLNLTERLAMRCFCNSAKKPSCLKKSYR